ncbi:MAG: arsenosugar biosynthesis radical SAM protein ArsS [Candidatus Sericytochromatia bacterium]|nr:arsenosugar biosynthesis radical SAM protein ArsS [Candidatus Sericytochromatia bacterium]
MIKEIEVTNKYDFERTISKFDLSVKPISIETLQINITKLCNQACHHCHVNASPIRTEMMSRKIIDKCLQILRENKSIKMLDITGGAPELHPDFDYVVTEAIKLNKHVMVRHNLTVTFDGNPQTKEKKMYLPQFFADNRVEVISSLPYYQEFFTDKQRGKGVFKKSIDGLKILNSLGYGIDGTGLIINLVYNPVGSFLPADQKGLEDTYKRELFNKFDISFNNLYTITNMPINRFKTQLKNSNTYDEYMDKLLSSFNPKSTDGLMCRSLISVGYDGKIYDCDFNQMLDIQIKHKQSTFDIFDFDMNKLLNRKIAFDSHCFGCTAGAGSSCTGTTS